MGASSSKNWKTLARAAFFIVTFLILTSILRNADLRYIHVDVPPFRRLDLDNEAASVDLYNSGDNEYINITYDYSREALTLWPNDSGCSEHKVYFGKNLPGRLLMTFPRSGNTWTRYLLESATGIFTGSIYKNPYLASIGFLGEREPALSPRTLITMTHKLKIFINDPKLPVLMIIRNPARSIISFWNFVKIDGGFDRKFQDSIDNSSYTTKKFHKFVSKNLATWFRIYSYPLKNASRVHVISYEKLREDPLKSLREMLRFLRVEPNEDRLSCLSRHLEGKAKGAQRELDPYSDGEKKKFDKSIQEINTLLKGRGFSPLPDYDKYNN